MNPAPSVVILPANSIQNVANSYLITSTTNKTNANNIPALSIAQSNKSNNHNNNSSNTNNIQSLIILSSANSAPAPINISSLNNQTVLNKVPIKRKASETSSKIKRHQPIKPKLSVCPKTEHSVTKVEPNQVPKETLSSVVTQEPIKIAKRRAAPTKKEKSQKSESTLLAPDKNENKETKPKANTAKKSKKRTKRDDLAADNLALSLDPKITSLIESIGSADKATEFSSPRASYSSRQSRISSFLPASARTHFSQSLFDSIDYLSSSWTNIFKTGNDTNQDSLNLFRQFHCVDCLKSFHQQQADNKSKTNSSQQTNSTSQKGTQNTSKNKPEQAEPRMQMHTPPPPLQPIIAEAKNGLYHYFGQQNQQHPAPLPHNNSINPTPMPNSYMNSQYVNVNIIQNNNPNELKLMPNLTQIGSNIQNTMSQQQQQHQQQQQQHQQQQHHNQHQIQNAKLESQVIHSSTNGIPFISNCSPFMISSQPNQMLSVSVDSKLSFSGVSEGLLNTSSDGDMAFEDDDRMSQSSIQEKGQSLSRKLAQRRPKKELIECGILPSSRVSMQHHNRMVDLKKAQLQDILKTKIEKRPNRDTLIQKNILPDSAPHAAPSLIRKCTELKRARLADDLNDKLAKRPGPLELVESGILVSSDKALTDAIKDGKIQYPRTSTYIQQLEQQVNYDQTLFSLDDLNFNFSNLTDNDDSNSSTSTTKTNNTLASAPLTAPPSNLITNNVNSGNNNPFFQITSQSPQPAILPQTDVINFGELLSSAPSSVPSPNNQGLNQTLTKLSPASSPYNAMNQNYDFLPSAQEKSSLKSKTSKSKAFSSSSSVTSNGSSSSSKTNRSSRNNSQSSYSNGPGSNSSSYNRKLSQLIFHEYRGPNQKSCKSSISLKTTINLKKNSNNMINAFNFKSNLVAPNMRSTDTNGNGQSSTNTNEIFFDDSNDSTNNLNSAIMNIDTVSEALNPHKIRIRQQKIFLKYNSSKSRDNSNNGDHVNGEVLGEGTAVQQHSLEIPIGAPGSMANQNINLNQHVQSPLSQPPQMQPTASNSQDMHNRNLFQAKNNYLPINDHPTQGHQQPENPNQAANLTVDSTSNQIQENLNTKTDQTQTNKTEIKTNIEEMSLNELKEECRRRKLGVTGNKQKLIERIKSSMALPSHPQLNGVKSPDSGVNMDSSCSFGSKDQNLNNSVSNQKLKQTVNATRVGEQNIQKQPDTTTSSLDDFFNFLDIETLGADKKAEASKDQNSEHQVKLETSASKNTDNLSETKATLEMSLKNSAELLKQLSSIGQIEQMHQLESQMRESMQLIEKLKSASGNNNCGQQLMQPNACEVGNNFFQTINSYPNKLKTVTSIPSDLKQLGVGDGHETNSQNFQPNSSNNSHNLSYNQIQFSSQVHLKDKQDIPFNGKNTLDLHGFNQHTAGNNNNTNTKQDMMYQFDTLMKELTSHNLTDPTVRFTCDSPKDDENSNETDLIRAQRKKSLPSIGSLITQNQHLDTNQQCLVVEHTQHEPHQQKPVESHFDPNVHGDMEWTDTEFLKICEELDNANNIFNVKQMDQKHLPQQKPADLLINGNSNANYIHSFEANQNSYMNQSQPHQQQQQHIMYNQNSQHMIGFDPNQQQQMNQNHLMNNSQLLSDQNHQQQGPGILDMNGNANMLIPWELENDLNQIATYLQTPTV